MAGLAIGMLILGFLLAGLVMVILKRTSGKKSVLDAMKLLDLDEQGNPTEKY